MAGKNKDREQLEEPVKFYDLRFLEEKLENFTVEVRTGLKTANDSIRTLVTKSEGQVTPAQLSDALIAQQKTFDNQLKVEISKVHSEYAPVKTFNKWLFRAVLAQIIIIVAQIIYLNYLKVG